MLILLLSIDTYTHDSLVPESFHHTLGEEIYGSNFKPEGPLKGSSLMRNQMRHVRLFYIKQLKFISQICSVLLIISLKSATVTRRSDSSFLH